MTAAEASFRGSIEKEGGGGCRGEGEPRAGSHLAPWRPTQNQKLGERTRTRAHVPSKGEEGIRFRGGDACLRLTRSIFPIQFLDEGVVQFGRNSMVYIGRQQVVHLGRKFLVYNGRLLTA